MNREKLAGNHDHMVEITAPLFAYRDRGKLLPKHLSTPLLYK
jgi:hypothetical protein